MLRESQTTKLTSETIKVLILSDSSSIVEAVVSVLTEAQIKFNWQQVAIRNRYYDLLDARWDLILYDNSLTKINLSEAVSYLLEKHLEIPLIVINGESEIPSAVAAIRAGAADYIASDELTRLPEAIAKTLTESPSCLQTTCSTQIEQQLQKLITENADGIIVVSDRGIVQFVNSAALELLGKTREDLIGESLGFPVVNGDYLEVDIPLSSGQTLVAQMRVSQIQWLKANAYIVSLRDITHLKQAEAERIILLEEAQAANRAKDEFLAILSHELRTPLNPILGWSQLLLNGQLPESQIAKAAEIINRNAQLQTQLIEDILDISRIIRGKLKLQVIPVNLVTIIDNSLDTIRLAAQAKSIAIETDLEEIGSVRGDSRRLQQIVGNLLSNAIKFTPSGGKVTISLVSVNREIQQDNHLEIAYQPVPHARLQVKDTGKGIAPEFLPHVFDYFRQAEGGKNRTEGGLGLGLAIVRRLVELHAGEIKATSPGLGKGAIFTVFLPLTDTLKELAPIQNNAPRFKNLAEIKILIVDDDDASRDLLDFLLQDEGAEVLASKSATQALAAIEQFQPNILISDIGMPTMNGYDLIKKVREISETKEIKAIAVSGYASDPDQQKSLAAGFDLHLNKPLDVNNLIQIVTQLVNS